MDKRAQISVEYMIIVGFIIFIVTITAGTAFFYSYTISDRISSNHLNNFANKVISSSESVFFAGDPSRVTINAYLPNGIEAMEILTDNDKTLIVFTFTTRTGTSTIAYESNVPIELNGDFSLNEGLKRYRVIAETDRVIIREE